MLHVLRTAFAWGAIVLTLNFLSGCGATASLPNPSEDDAEQTGQYPAVVLVVLPGGTGFCSGTFISPNTVLTASHCALDTTGTWTVETNWGIFYTTQKVNLGPGTVSDPNDMALLIFSSNVASVSQNQVIGVSQQVNAGDTLRLVGFGCNNIVDKTGADIKRTGTNVVSSIDDYLEFITPAGIWSEKILGPDNRAGSCFGDSGGPALAQVNGALAVVGIAHAGGTDNSGNVDSEYVNLSTTENWNFLETENTNSNLGIVGM